MVFELELSNQPIIALYARPELGIGEMPNFIVWKIIDTLMKKNTNNTILNNMIAKDGNALFRRRKIYDYCISFVLLIVVLIIAGRCSSSVRV